MKILDLDIRYLEDFNVEKKGNKYIFSFMDKKTRKTMKFSDKENPIRMMNTLIHYKQCLGSSIEKNENINSEKKTFSEENIKIHFNGKNLPNNQSCPNLTSPLISPRQPTMPSSTSPRQTTSPNIHVNMQMMQMIQMYQMNPILLQQINPQMYQQIHTVHNQMNQISSMNNQQQVDREQQQQYQYQQMQQFSPRSFGNVYNTFNQMNNQQLKEGSFNNQGNNTFQNPKSTFNINIPHSSSSVPNTPVSTSPNTETSLLSKTPPKMRIIPTDKNFNIKFNSTPSSPKRSEISTNYTINPFLNSSNNTFNSDDDKKDIEDCNHSQNKTEKAEKKEIDLENTATKEDENKFLFGGPFVSLPPSPNDSSDILGLFSNDSPIVESILIDPFPKSNLSSKENVTN
eukprot:TRINITY_DN3180_c0_g1_i5.p1 TRINITY_DN3180_c0_g1~~TRINITY_DN3180_c0_g1_i5.p1  ORF type:complete len:461 (-),score=136.05 TRINITY_DN3180_c0_g1_i5:122-1318(-)